MMIIMAYTETLVELKQFMNFVRMKLISLELKIDNLQKKTNGEFYNPTTNKLERIV